MNGKKIIIMGAGVGGLTAAQLLSEDGYEVTVLEKMAIPGGVMQRIKIEDFTVDVGFRRYYGRIPEVLEYYKKVLGKQLIPYKLRIGILNKKRIHDREYHFGGIFRNLTAAQLLKGVSSIIYGRIKYTLKKPMNYEEKIYRRKGEYFTKKFSQSYFEKLKGKFWKEIPYRYPITNSGEKGNRLNGFIKLITKKEESNYQWFHPEQGNYTFINSLVNDILKNNGQFRYNQSVDSITKNKDGWSVSALNEGEITEYQANYLISSLPIEITSKLMQINGFKEVKEMITKREVVIVYFMMEGQPHFPHTCLRVTDEDCIIGRITNYASFGGKMVPEGKSCIGFEIFCDEKDVFFHKNDEEVIEYVNFYAISSGLISNNKLLHTVVKRIKNTEVGASWEDYKNNKLLLNLFQNLSKIPEFFQLNRTGIDKTIYAALKAREAINSGNTQDYLKYTAPELMECWKEVD